MTNAPEKRTVLIVDDDPSISDALASYISRDGMRDSVTAASTSEAWSIIRSSLNLTHMICDLRMPGGGSLDLLRRTAKVAPEVQCVLLTGFTSDLSSEDRAMLEAGHIPVIDKGALTEDWLDSFVGTLIERIDAGKNAERSLPLDRPMIPSTDSSSPLIVPGVSTTQTFDVFLSYATADQRMVEQVAEALREWELRVWFDRWNLAPGRLWQEVVERVIEQTKTAAVFVGPSGLGPWERREMYGCLCECVSRDMPVIPVLLPGAPETPRLPVFLRQNAWVDMRAGLSDEGLNNLVWGITGCRSWRSHRQRRD